MKQVLLTVKTNEKIALNTFEMILSGDVGGIVKPGQFINIRLDSFYLRRPISVCDKTDDTLTIIYKTVGNGTKEMSELGPGAVLDVLTGLGNGYNTEISGQNPVLIGGGAGVPPMYLLCKKLLSEGKKPSIIIGFNTKDEVFYKDKFESLGVKVFITTADGSFGIKGFVTDALRNIDYSYFYTCGPEPMFRAVAKSVKTAGQYSFEERMGCGFGACMGCSCKTLTGNKRICKDGPVMESEEIIWDD